MVPVADGDTVPPSREEAESEVHQSEDSDGAESDKTQFYSTPLALPLLLPLLFLPPKALQLLRPPPHHCRRCRPAVEEGVVERRRWRQDILASEGRLVARLDETSCEFCQVAQSLNEVLREGPGEVQSKYRLADIVETYDTRVRGTNFTANHLKTNYKLEDFKLNVFEFRGLALPTAGNPCRDACRFLGCFEFDDSAGHDLGHSMVSIFKGGFIKRLTWQPKPTYVVSLKVSLQHFVEYFESEERMVGASGSYEGAGKRSQGTNLRPHDARSLPQGCGLFTKIGTQLIWPLPECEYLS